MDQILNIDNNEQSYVGVSNDQGVWFDRFFVDAQFRQNTDPY